LQEKIRIYALAKELDLESKDLIDLCRQHGIEVKNQLSSLDPDQRDAVAQLVKRGGGGVAVATPPKAASAVIPQVMTPVPVLHPSRPVRREPEPTKVPSKAPAAAATKPLEPPAVAGAGEIPPSRRAPAALAAEPSPVQPSEALPPRCPRSLARSRRPRSRSGSPSAASSRIAKVRI